MGPAARTVERVAGWGEHDGVDALMLDVLAHARADIDAAARARYARTIREARAATGLSLRRFARAVGTSASRLSSYEHAHAAPTTDVLGRIQVIADRLASAPRPRPDNGGQE